eukprot:TRINITY_DN13959_c0_g1_i2.p1 TRINITY_DN13959_c0_g1~~TRINITY_DN13959_c0_g1_i2.p1  ORF type:complete len:534 (+),score=109.65 TRINITY_DN13959_c0_g1_i2:71-1603(+)
MEEVDAVKAVRREVQHPVPEGWPREPIEVNITREMRERFQNYEGEVSVRVRTSGLTRTKRQILEKEIIDIERQTTVQGVLDALGRAKSRWMSMDCFSDIAFDGFAPAAEGAGNMFADVRFSEGENMSLGVYTDAQKISPEVKFTKNNINGMGYSAFVEVQPNKGIGVVIPYDDKEKGLGGVSKYLRRVSTGLDDALQYGVGYFVSTFSLFKFGFKSNAPYYGDYMEYNLSRQKDTHTRNAWTDEWTFDGGARIGFGRTVRQSLSIFTRTRELKHKSHPLITSSLSGFSYDAAYDTRRSYPHPSWVKLYPQPTSGHAFWASMEFTGKYAGMPSDDASNVSHVKAEVKAQKIIPLYPPYLHLTLSGRFGNIMRSQFEVQRSDRFYTETEHVRGFTKVGELDNEGGLVGGDILAAGSATLSFPLPTEPVVPYGIFAGHLFLDAAGVGKKTPGVSSWRTLQTHGAASVGFGVHVCGLPILGSMGRLEANISFPLGGGATEGRFTRRRIGLQWAV